MSQIHFSGKSIFPTGFAGHGVIKKAPMVWLDGARLAPIKPNYEFSKGEQQHKKTNSFLVLILSFSKQ